MKKYLRLPTLALLLFIGLMTIKPGTTFADDDNYIIITGQVTNTEYGNPLDGHKVYIRSETLAFASNFYFKTLLTDEDGFFYDTISTLYNYGSLEVYTFDHFGNKELEKLHFRFHDFTNNNSFLINFHIFMPFQTPILQAKFRAVKKVSGDKFRFKFIDETNQDEVLSWHWDFGDGSKSSLQNPEHIYSDYGMYKVSLAVVANINENQITSVISKFVFIPRINYYHMGGHCYSEYFPIDIGKAYLYSVDENDMLIPFDTTTFDEYGFYYFYQVPEGRYYVKTQPEKTSQYYGNWIPTYYGDTEFWKEASVIDLQNTKYTYHVNLVKALGKPEGDGKIAGKVSFISGDRSEIEYPDSGVDIYLLDANNNPMYCLYTDEGNYFNFDNLAIGPYWIYPELTGFSLEKQKIQLTEEIPVVQDIEILINTDAVYLIFPDVEGLEDNFTGAPYPNPASTQLSFEFNSRINKDITVELVDLTGKIVLSKTLRLESGLNKNTIGTSNLNPGLYILRLSARDVVREKKIMISR